MTIKPLLRKRAALPASVALFAATTLLTPKITLHAEAPSDSMPLRKPIYDDIPPRNKVPETTPSERTDPSTPTPTDRLAVQIRRVRLFTHAHVKVTENHVNALMSRFLHLESSFTSTIASLAPAPDTHERVMPGALYVLVAAMSGSILTRNRNILLRASVPLGVGIGAGWMLLPYTMRNVADLVWEGEKRVPVLAENHLRIRAAVVQGVAEARMGGQAVREWAEEQTGRGRRVLEEWIRRGR